MSGLFGRQDVAPSFLPADVPVSFFFRILVFLFVGVPGRTTGTPNLYRIGDASFASLFEQSACLNPCLLIIKYSELCRPFLPAVEKSHHVQCGRDTQGKF